MLERSPEELIVGVEIAADGEVVELRRLQREGYASIKVLWLHVQRSPVGR